MIMQKNKTERLLESNNLNWVLLGFFLLIMQVSSVWANNSEITSLSFSSLSGGKLQIHIGMNGSAVTPKVFQTINPARIALDFSGVKSALGKKRFPINQGSANAVYVVETPETTRVVINLTESVPYEIKVVEKDVFIVLKPINSISVDKAPVVTKKLEKKPETTAQSQSGQGISNLFPVQTIKNIDFRRGAKGEGRLLIEFTLPNTVVNVKEIGGKVVLNFVNTKLPEKLAQLYDVSDFATPIQKFDAQTRGAGVNISLTPFDGNYDYASYQSDRLLTIDFIPLTPAEKEALLKEKFPYSGDKLSLNFQDIEVRSVLQILADFTELNIIASDSVGGTVTLRLNDVPWDQALDLILKSKGLSKRKTGNVVLVAPTSEIIKIEEAELEAKKVVEQLEPLRTEYIQINYAKAEEIQALLTGQGVVRSSGARGGRSSGSIDSGGGGSNRGSRNRGGGSGSQSRSAESVGLLSNRGHSTVDGRTNTLIVKDTAQRLEDIRKLIKLLDIPIRQVMIEARIVVASTSFAQEMGVNFGVAQDVINAGGGKSYTIGAGGVETASVLSDLAGALAASSGGALALTLARGADYVLNLEISALEDNGETELLSNPRVVTTDRVEAKINQGVQIPFQTQSQDGPVTQLIDAVLELKVTPQITPSGSVIMELDIKNDAPGASLQTGGQLTIAIDTREINTTVQVEDGETIVLGGIYESATSEANNRVPWLADLPGVGWLFRQTNNQTTKRELLIFVTPKIIKNALSAR